MHSSRMRTARSLTERISWYQARVVHGTHAPQPCIPPSHTCPLAKHAPLGTHAPPWPHMPPQPCMPPRHTCKVGMHPQAHTPPGHVHPLATHATRPCMPPRYAHPLRHAPPRHTQSLGTHAPPAMRAPRPHMPQAMHVPIPPSHIPPPWTEWQTGIKILPCPKLRLQAVKISYDCMFQQKMKKDSERNFRLNSKP